MSHFLHWYATVQVRAKNDYWGIVSAIEILEATWCWEIGVLTGWSRRTYLNTLGIQVRPQKGHDLRIGLLQS